MRRKTDSTKGAVALSPITGFVYAADGSASSSVTLSHLTQNTVEAQFASEPSMRPSWLVMQSPNGQSETFPYVPASPLMNVTAVFRIADLKAVCPQEVPNADPTGPARPCDDAHKLQLKTLQTGMIGDPLLMYRQHDLLFVSLRGYNGDVPSTLAVMNADGKSSTLARRVSAPGNDQSALGINMTIMDQETMRRNYGAEMAEKYFAIKIDLANRISKKLQFNKSAVYFDVDFIGTDTKYRTSLRNKIADGTLDLVAADVYDTKYTCIGCRRYYFGIDQNEHIFADSYLAVLGSFDYVTQRTDRALRIVELLGSALTTIATGGAVAQINNTAFRDATAILTGVFLPGGRGIVMNNAEINRERANLAAQTFQEVVQLPPNGHGSTIILLPREPILAIDGREEPVLIDRIINVHIDPDVLNGIKEPPVPVGHMELGYSRDQARQSLGEPTAVTSSAEGTSKFEYAAGPYEWVTFTKDGQAITWSPRSVGKQIDTALTVEAVDAVVKSNPGSDIKKYRLRDDQIIVSNVPGIEEVLLFTKDGKRNGTYMLLEDKITALKGTKSQVETAIGQMQLPKAANKYPPKQPISKGDQFGIYAMPDVADWTIRIEFSEKPIRDNTPVSNITVNRTP